MNNYAVITGGAVHTIGVDFVAGGSGSITTGDTNTSLRMVHCTVAYNTSDDDAKSGITFANGSATTGPHFNIYNSIVVSADDVSKKALNFANSNANDVINNILGGLNSFAAVQDLNNEKGKTATFAGLAGSLSDEGGNTHVIVISGGSNSEDYCSSTTGITLPTSDQRGYTRSVIYDAGAYEIAGVLLNNNKITSENFNIYPNPANEFIHINVDIDIQDVKLYSMLGDLVKDFGQAKILDVSNINSGIYLIKVTDENNKQFIKQVVIE
ncbi:MAG: T9SS type A sorting domain-containing protein [Flavicella sp.]|nr:T9SS type A sorting domain-containing protein [Flavicella sp.]